MDLTPLAQSFHRYFQEGPAPSTQKTYQAAMKQFTTVCTTFGTHYPFPLTELLLSYYAVHLADQGLAPQTIKSHLAALHHAQISMGLSDPRDHSSMAPAQKGAGRQASAKSASRQVPPGNASGCQPHLQSSAR